MKGELIYRWAVICYAIHGWIGWKYPEPVDGRMVERWPKIQHWLSRQIPYDNW